MFLIVLSYGKPLVEVGVFLAEHRAFLDRYYAAGNFLLSGPRELREGGVILATASSISELEAIVRNDPFHRERIAAYDIFEFLPSMASTPLAHLKGL